MQSPILFHVAFSLFIRISLLNLIQTNEITSALRGKNNIIYLNEKSTQTIRLKSIFNIQNQNLTTSSKSQKIFWSFKRIYALPNFHESNIYDVNNVFVKTTNELSQNELMISLDSEVQDNLKNKYSISEGEEEENLGENENANLDSKNDKFDLIIRNITYADSGLYKCNLWNQKTLYYYLTVSSNSLFRQDFINPLTQIYSLYFHTKKVPFQSQKSKLSIPALRAIQFQKTCFLKQVI